MSSAIECLTKFNQLILIIVNIFVAVSVGEERGREGEGAVEERTGGFVRQT